MKHLSFILFSVLLSVCLNTSGFAQNSSGKLWLGGGFGYGFEIQSLAFQADGVYQINEAFRGGANIIYYLPGEDINGVEFGWFEFNANGHYVLLNSETWMGYIITGLNFAKLTSDDEDVKLPGGDNTDTLYIGVNIGAGTEFNVGNINLYVEGKYALSSAHQLVLTGGVRIPIIE